jgi:uncharacterized protein YdcH (DUF465 family)
MKFDLEREQLNHQISTAVKNEKTAQYELTELKKEL